MAKEDSGFVVKRAKNNGAAFSRNPVSRQIELGDPIAVPKKKKKKTVKKPGIRVKAFEPVIPEDGTIESKFNKLRKLKTV